MTESTLVGTNADFTKTHVIKATPAVLRAALTTDEGVSGWWAPTVTPESEVLAVSFGDRGVEVRVIVTPERVVWDVLSCSAEPDWVGTTIEFATAAHTDGTIDLAFTHRGLGALPCAEDCFAGWTHFLPSLAAYVESGVGYPQSRNA